MRLPDEKRQQMEVLLHEGHSDLSIQQQAGIDRRTVARHRKRLGLPGYRTTVDSPACRYGHPFPDNAIRNSNGWLECRACRRQRDRERYVPAQLDEIAIERAVAGDPPQRLTPQERAAAVQQIDSWQYNAPLIAERVGCSPRTVYRIRARLKTAA